MTACSMKMSCKQPFFCFVSFWSTRNATVPFLYGVSKAGYCADQFRLSFSSMNPLVMVDAVTEPKLTDSW